VESYRFKLKGSGAARVLGELESRIMEVVWERGPSIVKEIHSALGASSHYKTVLTVANRLVDKGLLLREESPGERAFRYRAAESREVFLARISSSVATELVTDFGRPALAQFVQAVDEIDPAYLDELERLVRERRRTH
jgi:predicted transcriptional regulator